MFDYISKHREEGWKYDAQQSIFDKLWGVWKCGQKLSWVFDIFSNEAKTKEKTKKTKSMLIKIRYPNTFTSFVLTWWIINEFEKRKPLIAQLDLL